ncbi:MAG: anaerobic ribonucleoside-triphosphate reductase activating protein [bacterium]|nr:anaerobic ribonucleoside-triphosphate reductase activating protein [bacterium]
MQIRLAAPLIFDSIVDGPGLRTVVFTQGCKRHCPGCHNPETHDLLGGKLYDVEEIKGQIVAAKMQQGITLSGGEPFLQAAACCELAKAAHAKGMNVWAFSGFRHEELAAGTPEQQALLKEVDVLVDGPFMIEQRSLDLMFKGSRNQRTLKLENGKIVGQLKDTL